MASADTEETGEYRCRAPGGVEGGNPGKFSNESPEGLMLRQDDP